MLRFGGHTLASRSAPSPAGEGALRVIRVYLRDRTIAATGFHRTSVFELQEQADTTVVAGRGIIMEVPADWEGCTG